MIGPGSCTKPRGEFSAACNPMESQLAAIPFANSFGVLSESPVITAGRCPESHGLGECQVTALSAALTAGQAFEDRRIKYSPSWEISVGHSGHRALTFTIQSVRICRNRRRAKYSVVPSWWLSPQSPKRGTWAVLLLTVQLFQTTHM